MNNVFCNMIAGTTPQWLKDSMPPHAIGGGFTSRILFVYQEKPEKLIPFPTISDEMRRLREVLTGELKVVARLRGEYKLTKDAREWYGNWYTKVFQPEITPYASLDGYYGRKHDTLLKVAMCLSASKSNNMMIDEIELKMALRAMNKNEKFLPRTLNLIQMTDEGEEKEKVLRVIGRRGVINHVYLMQQVSYCMGVKRLEEVLTDLIVEDRVEHYIDKGKRWYKLKGRG